MTDPARCAECGAPVEGACRDYFDTLLQLEWDVPGARGSVLHFYLVTCYVLQHPVAFNYSAEALALGRRNLADLLDGKTTLERVRRDTRERFAGATRVARPADATQETPPTTRWPMTVADVATATVETFAERVTAWARSIRSTLEQ